MTTIDHDEAVLLLGPYALDALDTTEERDALERHLEACASCRARLDGYREAAARLAPEVAPPTELWERIAGELQPAVVLPMRARTTAAPRRAWLAAVAAAAALVLGVGVGRISQRDSSATVGEVAAEARDEAGSTVLTLVDADGRPTAEAILTADGLGYLTNHGLPSLDADRGYQLWALRDGQPVSVALLGAEPEVESFRTPSRFDQLLITEEPAIGSPSPTTTPVASATA